MIKTSHVFVVIGPPGCGKSTAVHHIALQLHDEDNYDLIPAKFPNDITQYYHPERKQIFVFDDLCGKYTLEIQTVNAWEKLCCDIKSAISKDTVKILFTCRAYIFYHKKVKNLQIPWRQLDLLSPEYVLSNEEKDLIASIHLSKEQVEDLKQHQDLNQYECFPLLCQLCSSKGTCDVVNFFASPVDVIKADLCSIMESDDQTTIATLALFVVFNNSLNEQTLSPKNQELRDLLQQLSQILTTRHNLSVQIVKDHLYSLTNTYVAKTCNKFTLLHNKLFDIIASFFGERMVEFTIEYSHPEFIRDRFQFESINEHMEECIISIGENLEQDYFNRLYKDIENGYMNDVFSNRQLQFNSFRIKFIQSMKKHIESHDGLLCSDKTTLLMEVAKKGQTDVVELLIESGIDPNISDKYGRTAVYFAAEKGHVETVKLLVAKKCDLNISRNDYWHKDESPLYVAAANGHLDVLKLLYRNKQDCYRAIKEAFYCGKTPLHGAIEGNHAEIVTFFMENECDPNIINEDHESPLWLASGNGNREIVEILLNHGSKPNLHTKKNGPPLIIASWKGHTTVVQLLLLNGADPNMTNAKGCSPLFYAAHEGAIEIVRLLLQNNANINCQTKSKMTPLFIAAIKGRRDVVETLLLSGAHINLCNDNRESPLFVASKEGLLDIVKLLLYFHAKIDIENIDGETALSVADKYGFTEIENALSNHIGHSCKVLPKNRRNVDLRMTRGNACCTIS